MPLIQIDRLPVREIFPACGPASFTATAFRTPGSRSIAGATFPEHQHPHEQIVSMIAGELELVVDGVTHRLTPGQVFVIPPDARHSGRALTACRVLDAFAPIREDYR